MVPIEAVAVASTRILEEHGGIMIPAVGMPGAACTFRIMMDPDGLASARDERSKPGGPGWRP